MRIQKEDEWRRIQEANRGQNPTGKEAEGEGEGKQRERRREAEEEGEGNCGKREVVSFLRPSPSLLIPRIRYFLEQRCNIMDGIIDQ